METISLPLSCLGFHPTTQSFSLLRKRLIFLGPLLSVINQISSKWFSWWIQFVAGRCHVPSVQRWRLRQLSGPGGFAKRTIRGAGRIPRQVSWRNISIPSARPLERPFNELRVKRTRDRWCRPVCVFVCRLMDVTSRIGERRTNLFALDGRNAIRRQKKNKIFHHFFACWSPLFRWMRGGQKDFEFKFKIVVNLTYFDGRRGLT